MQANHHEFPLSPAQEQAPPARRPKGSAPLPQLHGVLVLHKPSGPSSAQCLTALKRLGQKKIGHAGTLDPLASGVLLVLLGQATKLSEYLRVEGGKIYRGVLRLGQETDTWDGEGTVLSQASWEHVRPEEVRQEIAAWAALQEQEVPPYSAAKHQGQPLYKLARKGLDVPVKIKAIHITMSATLDVRLPYVSFRVACSSGTYIRSLAHSLGMRLRCGAVLTELTREYSHPFGLDTAVDLATLEAHPERLRASVHPLADALPAWSQVVLTPAEAACVRNGMPIPCRTAADGAMPLARQSAGADHASRALLLDEGKALALARRTAGPSGWCWTICRGLWE